MSNIGTKFLLANRFIFEPNSNSLTDQHNNEIVRLGSNESRILLMLTENSNQVLTRHELHEFVWREQGFEVDDSSLTQAISTLRKMLKDSTKSPAFIKTVPKRGYQLICSVERMSASPSDSVSTHEHEEQQPLLAEIELVAEPITAPLTDAPTTIASTQALPSPQQSKHWAAYILLLLSALLPIGVVLLSNPAASTFEQIGEFHDIPVVTPANHPPLDAWLPLISQCIKSNIDISADTPTPFKIIATGGQNNQLILNYIFPSSDSHNNASLIIIADRNNLTEICHDKELK